MCLQKIKKRDSDTLESCKKIGYGYAEIEYKTDGTMYNRTLRDIEDFKAESELRLSNNSKYISSCKKTIKPIVVQENDGDINHE